MHLLCKLSVVQTIRMVLSVYIVHLLCKLAKLCSVHLLCKLSEWCSVHLLCKLSTWYHLCCANCNHFVLCKLHCFCCLNWTRCIVCAMNQFMFSASQSSRHVLCMYCANSAQVLTVCMVCHAECKLSWRMYTVCHAECKLSWRRIIIVVACVVCVGNHLCLLHEASSQSLNTWHRFSSNSGS